MWTAAQQSNSAQAKLPPGLNCASYIILGVPVEVRACSAEAMAQVDETYAAFRGPGSPEPAFAAWLDYADDSGYLVADSHGSRQFWPDAHAATIGLLDRLVHGVLAELHARGIYAIHAGACVYQGAALIIAGRSGQGKTTLTLGLLQRGFGLLSDEFAVAEPGTRQILPYHRSIHIRPGTPELIGELRFVSERPPARLGGGIEWTLTPADLAQAFPGSLAPSAPLGAVLILDGAPQPGARPTISPLSAAVATIELLRGTWAASRAFADGLGRIGRLLDGTRCARLRAGTLDTTTECIAQWLEAAE